MQNAQAGILSFESRVTGSAHTPQHTRRTGGSIAVWLVGLSHRAFRGPLLRSAVRRPGPPAASTATTKETINRCLMLPCVSSL